MDKIGVPDVLRASEIVMDLIMIGVYYGTDTVFKVSQAGNGFGEFVIIGGLVFGIVMLGVCIAFGLYKKCPYAVIGYNVIWFVFYFSAGIMIMVTWSGYNHEILEKAKGGGICVGVFCLINCGILVASSFLVFKDK